MVVGEWVDVEDCEIVVVFVDLDGWSFFGDDCIEYVGYVVMVLDFLEIV